MQNKRVDLEGLKRSFSRERLLALAKTEGLGTHGERMACPRSGCAGGDPRSDKRACSVSDGNEGAVYCCHRCGQGGSAIDLLMQTRGVDAETAIKSLSETATVAVSPPAPRTNGAQVWEALAQRDIAGEGYLLSRGLGPARPWVRFNVGGSGNAWCDDLAKRGYRLAVALVTVEGVVRSFQLRSISPKCEPAWSKLSLKGVSTERLMFGHPELVATAQVVHLCEGLADTLAVTIATAEQEGHVVVGVPGVDQVMPLGSLLGDRLKGREVWLYPQNDKLTNKARLASEDAFKGLALELERRGAARVATVSVPPPAKDYAEAWQARPVMLQPAAPAPPPAPPATVGTGGAPPTPSLPLQKSYASLCQILRHPNTREHALGLRALEYNEMSHAPTLGRVEVPETEVGAIRERVELAFSDSKGKGLAFNAADVQSAVLQIAAERPYHPVREYLEGLTWDGQERIHRLLAEVLHSQPTEIKQRIMRWWMISAVARGLSPGCKVDSVLILQGKQGRKKSTFFSTLVGRREWFSDSQVDLAQKDAYQLLHSCWIWEWGELETLMRARRMSAVKNFVSSAQDSFRAPYAKATRLYLRSSVIVGSTNDEDFLADPTGHRRWWVVDVHDRIRHELLADWRDQLWAEAVAYYKGKEPWYAEGEEEEGELTRLAQQYEVRDAWEEVILNWGSAPRDDSMVWQPFSTADVLTSALQKPAGQWTRGDEMRVVDILARAGYKKDRNPTERALGGRSRLWRQGPGMADNVAPRA